MSNGDSRMRRMPVFRGILQETGKLATAVRALIFDLLAQLTRRGPGFNYNKEHICADIRLHQMIYYDWQQNWDLLSPVTAVAS